MPLQFNITEILQRTKDAQTPVFTLDVARWADGRKAGSVQVTLVDVNAAGTRLAAFTIPRTGLYRVQMIISCGVAATPRRVRFVAESPASGQGLWDENVLLASGGQARFGPMDLLLFDGDGLFMDIQTAMVLGDSMTGSLTNWELAT